MTITGHCPHGKQRDCIDCMEEHLNEVTAERNGYREQVKTLQAQVKRLILQAHAAGLDIGSEDAHA